LVGKANLDWITNSTTRSKVSKALKKIFDDKYRGKSNLKPFQISSLVGTTFVLILHYFFFFLYNFFEAKYKENFEPTILDQMKEIPKNLNFFDNFFSMMLSTLELDA
jgi:hypothetical protein